MRLGMRYTQPSFSVPVGNARISQHDYEVAVGLRCPRCQALLTAKHECKLQEPDSE